MNSSLRRFLVAGILMLVFVMSSCYIDFGGSGGTKRVTVTEFGWTYSNVNTAYWPDTAPSEEVFLSFALRVQETNLLESDFGRVTFSARGESWTVDSSGLDYDASNSVLTILPLSLEDSPYALPLTGWTVTVELANGMEDSRTFDLNPPGEREPDSNWTHVHNESYADPPGTYVEMVNQPSVSRHEWSGSSIKVNFEVNDTDVYNGWVEFYDSGDRYLGRSTFFVDWESGATNEALITSGPLDTQDNTNVTSIEEADVDSLGNAAFSDIAKVVVVVSDGFQYKRASAYNYQGISGRFDLGAQ